MGLCGADCREVGLGAGSRFLEHGMGAEGAEVARFPRAAAEPAPRAEGHQLPPQPGELHGARRTTHVQVTQFSLGKALRIARAGIGVIQCLTMMMRRRKRSPPKPRAQRFISASSSSAKRKASRRSSA